MPAQCESCGHAHEQWIPRQRFDEVTSRLKQATDRHAVDAAKIEELGQARTQLDTYKAKATELEGAAGQLEAAQARLAELEAGASRSAVTMDLLRAGITTDEGLTIVHTLYDALPADQRPASVSEWLGSDTLPSAVRVYLPKPTPTAPQGEGTQGGAGGTKTQLPTSTGVVPTPPGSGGKLDLSKVPTEKLGETLARFKLQ